VDPHSRDGGLSRSGGGTDQGGRSRSTSRTAARIPKVAKLYAFYAAGAGFRDGRPAEHCPYDQPGEERAARHLVLVLPHPGRSRAQRARPATPPAEFRQKPPRKVHHSKRVVTTSAAYAEQLGIEPD
jgi:hypothetical protein